eukprot:TRINITY_DN910_c2_g1_i1.p1 TRINITY_DN910_c2_g1~~TRINITY_DN910_c2_g1_i1.p1  ORF type:complete len:444 (+),score=103.24 TRINITY_DN910_c2_g1_i1:45-1376(+)
MEEAGGPAGLTSGVWIPIGASKAVPEKYVPSSEEMERARGKVAMMAAEAGDGDEDENMDDEEFEEIEEIDDDDDFNSDDGPTLEVPLQGTAEGIADIESDDESEMDDLHIKNSDMLFMCTHQRHNGEPSLEVYIYDDSNQNIFLHHDIPLPAIPLCVTWCGAGYKADNEGSISSGSYAAVTTFLPFIEVWDLDVIEAPDPVVTLGGCKRTSDNYRSKTLTSRELKKSSHQDSVLCARWNPGVRKVLASGSADLTVKLWDLATAENLHTFKHHQAPIQCVEWCAKNPQLMLTGSFDQTVCMVDCRSQKVTGKIDIGSTPEAMQWSQTDENLMWMTTDTGKLVQYDSRKGGKPSWSVQAHTGEASGLTVNNTITGLIATSGVDQQIKLWDVRSDPSVVCSRDLGQGRVFGLQFSPDKPTFLLASGDAGKPLVYCVTEDVSSAFST